MTDAAINVERVDTTGYVRMTDSAVMVEYIDNQGLYCGPGDIGLVVYLEFSRGLHCYLSRADEEGLSMTDEFTMGGWVWFGYAGRPYDCAIIGKWYESTDDRGYVLYKDKSGNIVFSVSESGNSALTTIQDGGEHAKVSQWHYIVARYKPSTELALFVDGDWYSNVTDIPASIHDSAEAFEIGRSNRSNYFDGRMSHIFVSAVAIDDVDIEAMYHHTRAMYSPPSEHGILPSGITERVSDVALMIEYLPDDLFHVSSVSLGIEYLPASFINVSNAALMIEYIINPNILVTNFGLQIERVITTPMIKVTNFGIMVERAETTPKIRATNFAIMIERTPT